MKHSVSFLLTLTLALGLASCGGSEDGLGEGSSETPAPTTPTAPSQPGDWVLVPANTGGMGLGAFYVMKYEAKAWNDANTDGVIDTGEVDSDGQSVATGSNIPVSTEDNQPWRSITANDSAAECESLGANYHLISNPEWMAITSDIENVDANWTGGSVGSGCLFRGNSGDGGTCGYNSATNPDSGTGRNPRAKHTLSSGEEIFDISGNLAEWTDWDSVTTGFQTGPTSCASSWTELPSVSCGALASADYDTSNGTYTSTQGVGQLLGGSGGAALRGGNWVNGARAGAFALDLTLSLGGTSSAGGFRCVYRP